MKKSKKMSKNNNYLKYKVSPTLRALGADRRRIVLTPKDVKDIQALKNKGFTSKSVAEQYGVSRQRIEFIWLPEDEQRNRVKLAVERRKSRYNTNTAYREKSLELKKATYKHRKNILYNYEKHSN